MKYVKAIKWLFVVALFGVSMTSCAVLGSLLGGNAQIFMTYPELGSTVTITNSSQSITLKGSVTSDADIDTVTINPNGVGLKPANFFAGNWYVDLTVSPQDYTIEVTAKDVNGAESKETFSFTVVLDANAAGGSSSSASYSSVPSSMVTIQGILNSPTNGANLDWNPVDVHLATNDVSNNGFYTNIDFTYSSTSKGYYFYNLPIGYYHVFAVVHIISTSGSQPTNGDYVGDIIVNAPTNGAYEYQNIQLVSY